MNVPQAQAKISTVIFVRVIASYTFHFVRSFSLDRVLSLSFSLSLPFCILYYYECVACVRCVLCIAHSARTRTRENLYTTYEKLKGLLQHTAKVQKVLLASICSDSYRISITFSLR